MKWNERKAKDAIEAFSFGSEELVAASEVFRSEMEKGIAGDKSSTLKGRSACGCLAAGSTSGRRAWRIR